MSDQAQALSLQQALLKFVSIKSSFLSISGEKLKASPPIVRDFVHPAISDLFEAMEALIQWSQIVEYKINDLEASFEDDFEEDALSSKVHEHGRLVDGSGIVLTADEVDKFLGFFNQLGQQELVRENPELQGAIQGWMMLLTAKIQGISLQEYTTQLRAMAEAAQKQG